MAPQPRGPIQSARSAARDYLPDATPGETFDRLAALAAQVCAAPCAFIALRAEDRTIVLSAIGCSSREIVDLDVVDVVVGHQDLLTLNSEPPVTVAPITTAEGVAIGAIGIITTDLPTLTAPQEDGLRSLAIQVMAQLELRRRARRSAAAEERYRALFDDAPDGIAIADPAGHLTDVNRSLCAMLGYEAGELIGAPIATIVAPDQIERIVPAIEEVARGADYMQPWRLRHRAGSIVPADVIATVLPDGKLLGIVRDASERTRALAAVRATEERIRFVLESAKVGVWDLDYATGAATWSPIAEAQYGLAPGTFSGGFEAFLARVHPDDRAALLETTSRAQRTGSDFQTQHRAVWPDGTVRWISGSGRVHLDDQGQPTRAVGISVDVTERCMLEQRYQQAQKMDAIGRLAGGIAHDFNNLLTAILGYCELLALAFDAADPRLGDVAEIEKASRRAASLTRQLLAFSRKQIIAPVVLDLNALVTDMRSMLSRLIGEHIRIAMTLDPALSGVRADPGQIEQVLMNLAVNARDAMPTGGTMTIETSNVTLAAPLSPALPAGRYVRLTIADTGVGMPPEVQSRVFEPFFTTKDVGKGSGLGLATVHGIVAQSGGDIRVESEPGRGTTFTIDFPMADAPAINASSSAVASLRGAGQVILVVEDADALRELTRRLLTRLGYRVLVAENGEHALSVYDLHGGAIDLLLTDVVMPGISGPALAQRLLARHPGLRVVFVSGYSDAVVAHGVAESREPLLHKPFTSDALAQRIADALAH